MISLISFIITLGIILLVIYFSVENFHNISLFFDQYIGESINAILDKVEALPFMGFLLEHEVIYMTARYVIIFTAGMGLYYLFFILYGSVLGWFTGSLVKIVRRKHYSNIAFKGIGIIRTMIFYVKTIVITVFIFVVLLPLYVFPVANLMLMLAPYYFFHKTIVFDVASVVNDALEYQKIKKVNWTELKGITGICFAMSLIPIIGIFLYPLYIIFVSHYMLKETEELRIANHFV